MILEFGIWKHKTETLVNAGSHGKWHPKEPIKFECIPSEIEIENTRLRIAVMEENDLLKNSIIGEVSASLSTMLALPGVKRELDLQLFGTDGKKSGRIKVNIVYRKPSGMSGAIDQPAQLQVKSAVAVMDMANVSDHAMINRSAVTTEQVSTLVRPTPSSDNLLHNIFSNGSRLERSFVPTLNHFPGLPDDTTLHGMKVAGSKDSEIGCFEISSIEVHGLPNKEIFGYR